VPEGEHTEIVKQFVAAVEAGKQVSAVKYIDSGAALRREDIGPVSTAESALKDAEIEKLRSSKRSLESKIAGLESEVEELRTENAALRAQREAAKVAAPATSSEIATANTVIAGDAGPFPTILLRGSHQ